MKISVVTPCYNEEGNVRLAAERVAQVIDALPGVTHEHIFADNRSTDNTLAVLKEMAQADRRIKVIANARNFGPSKSTFNAVLAASGDVVVLMAADLQDPPECIPDLVEQWRAGFQVVFGIRAKRVEFPLFTLMRKLYYRILCAVSEDELIADAGDFVLMDKAVVDVLRRIHDTNPYLRGLLSSLGFPCTGVSYHMQARHSGPPRRNFMGLFAYGLNGFINHTMLPLRLATFLGLGTSLLCFLSAIVYAIVKLFFWNYPPPGFPTLLITIVFIAGVQLFILGFLGEMMGAMFRQSRNIPLVIERERINFNKDEAQ